MYAYHFLYKNNILVQKINGCLWLAPEAESIQRGVWSEEIWSSIDLTFSQQEWECSTGR